MGTNRIVVALMCLIWLGAHGGSCWGQTLLQKFRSDARQAVRAGVVQKQPPAAKDTAIEALAREIDWLESHIDKYGSVVAKQPDVWGESRLTRFRGEYEAEMAKQLESFKLRDNAAISTVDLAFLASATGLGLAIDGGTAIPQVSANLNAVGGAAGEAGQGNNTPGIQQQLSIQPASLDQEPRMSAAANLEVTEELNQRSRYLNHLQHLRRINSGDDTSDAPGYSLNLVRIPVSIIPGRETRRGYGAEVTITARPHLSDTLLPETFRSLVINDLADQLALPVIRIAEDSELEFNRAVVQFDLTYRSTYLAIEQQKAHQRAGDVNHCEPLTDMLAGIFGHPHPLLNLGAALQMGVEAQQVLAVKLRLDRANQRAADIESTNKRLEELGKFMSRLQTLALAELPPDLPPPDFSRMNRREQQLYLLATQTRAEDAKALAVARKLMEFCRANASTPPQEVAMHGEDQDAHAAQDAQKKREEKITDEYVQLMFDFYEAMKPEERQTKQQIRHSIGTGHEARGLSETRLRLSQPDSFAVKQIQMQRKISAEFHAPINELIQEFESLQSSISDLYYKDLGAANPVSRRRRSTMPIPPIQLQSLISLSVLTEVAYQFKQSYKGPMVAWNEAEDAPRFHLPDVRHYMQFSLEGAYRLLSQPENRDLLVATIESNGGLANQVRLANRGQLDRIRYEFLEQLQVRSGIVPAEELGMDLMHLLAWPIVVEMALLNEQLNRDVHDIAVTRGDCACLPHQRHAYYLPGPAGPEDWGDPAFMSATTQFQEYVRCRWPIHVFQVDPVTEDQNVQEASRLQRDLAIAAALGVASGRMNFVQANQFVRQYAQQIDLVGLNRTVAGFSHGHDTFGWRFAPRIQGHLSRGNLAAFGETLLGRREDARLREAGLEPGQRECTAIILMPSFVPYCDFEVSTNWFRLDNPQNTELSTHALMKLSRSIKQMQECRLHCIQCEHLYRDGEVRRLMNRVQQLDRRLPMQSLRVQIPYENTLGGFEMFSNGVTDLAPELLGWYGGPGVVIDGEGCCPDHCGNGGQTDSPSSLASEAKGTTIFLVGNNFSVHETQVIAGGVRIPREHVQIISRQIVSITVPPCVSTVTLDKRRFVAVHAATPYGVTSHLHVPAVAAPATAAAVQQAAINQQVQQRLTELARQVSQPAFTWADVQPIAIRTSYRSQAVAEANQRATFQRVELALVNPSSTPPVKLTWTNPSGMPAIQNPPPGQRRAGLVGQFIVGDRPFGTSFWLTGPEALDLLSQREFQMTAAELLEVLDPEIRRQLTLDATGNLEVVTLGLQAWVVHTVEQSSAADQSTNATGQSANADQSTHVSRRLVDDPRPVGNQLSLQLLRRVNPPTSQLAPPAIRTSQEPRATTQATFR